MLVKKYLRQIDVITNFDLPSPTTCQGAALSGDWCFSDGGWYCILVIPRSLFINEGCPSCDIIQSIHNKVWACRS